MQLFRDAKDKVLTEYENAFGFMCAFSFEDAFSKTLKCTFDTDMLVNTVVMTIIFVSGACAVLGFCLGWVLRTNGLKYVPAPDPDPAPPTPRAPAPPRSPIMCSTGGGKIACAAAAAAAAAASGAARTVLAPAGPLGPRRAAGVNRTGSCV